MREYATPDRWELVPLAYEEDAVFLRFIDEMSEKGQISLRVFLSDHKMKGYVFEPKPVIGYDDCYMLRLWIAESFTKPYAYDIGRARKKIAYEMGYLPAEFYPHLREHPDMWFRQTYRQSFRTRCWFGNDACVRPSHQIPCLWNGTPLREVHPYKIPLILDPYSDF